VRAMPPSGLAVSRLATKKWAAGKKARPTAYRPITRGLSWPWRTVLECLGWAKVALSDICATSPDNTHLPIVNFCAGLWIIQEAYPERFSHTVDQLDVGLRQSIRTDNQQSEDALTDELIVMAIKEPEAFSVALGALVPRPSKRRRQSREYK
jgi:hypothetical protein